MSTDMTDTTDTTEARDAVAGRARNIEPAVAAVESAGAPGGPGAAAGESVELRRRAERPELPELPEIEPGDELDVFDDVVDPRMRERWIAARRAEGRRRLYVLCAVAGTVAVVVIAYVIANSSLLGAGSVDVRGVDATAARAVRAAAQIHDGEPLLFLDTGAVARRVERIPTVARADVSTELPSTVRIQVTPRVPVAWLRTNRPTDPNAVLDRHGRVITMVATPPPGLPRVRGVGPASEPGAHVAAPGVLRALSELPAPLRSQVSRFEVRPDEGPVLVLGGAAPVAQEIRLGSLAQLRAKATAALAVMDAQQARGERVRIVGVQVPDAPYTQGSP
jgi:cell division protein FtsQ